MTLGQMARQSLMLASSKVLLAAPRLGVAWSGTPEAPRMLVAPRKLRIGTRPRWRLQLRRTLPGSKRNGAQRREWDSNRSMKAVGLALASDFCFYSQRLSDLRRGRETVVARLWMA